MSSFTERQAGLQKATRLLRKKFGKQQMEPADDVALHLLRFVLLEESSQAAVDEAMRHIPAGFVDLNELRISFPQEIAEVVPGVSHIQRKASRITQLFNAMFLRHNTMTWEFLRSYNIRDLRQYFEKIDGGDAALGAAAVMLLSPGHALPADSDVRRTLGRLGLTEAGEDVAALQGFLERAVSKEQGYETWALLHRLAESVCLVGEPVCAKCVLHTTCPAGIERLTRKAKKSEKKTEKKPAEKKPAEKKSKAAAKKPAKPAAKTVEKKSKKKKKK
jgi:endonuclease III